MASIRAIKEEALNTNSEGTGISEQRVTVAINYFK